MHTEPRFKPDLAALGHEVARRRQARGWSIDRLAEEAGISRKTVMSVEHATKGLKVATAYAVAQALGVSLAELVEVV